MPVRQDEGAGVQHLLKPLFWGKTVYYFKYLVAYATLFDLFFSQADIDTYSNFAWGLHGGVDVMWCGGLIVLDLH